ncbi:DUF3114 domain-containing protein [Candidatus Enterococcus murrayae]|uniref:DUF3114 domain-containing protein n=1 Tax=Candidatus Enterococcus murrayae TaxID=2815321 RepID=A0ABS3HMG3_9ENTE|nr:DUF3114 domain-containing protein [Enterococcus sp. MJM16]MBO0454633.1 DUF3114 domain-containing protein [Enterococcus sp. MJM16]
MNIDMYVSSSRAQASSVKAMCQKQIQGYRQLQQAINQFVMSSGELQGKTYDSAKQYFSAVLSPLAKGGMLLAEATAKACQKFPDDYQSQVDSGDLKSSELEEQIQQYKKGIDTANSIMKDISSSSLPEPAKKIVLKSIKNVKEGQEKAKKKLDKKLKKLKAFHASSPSIFSEIAALESAVNTGAAQAATCWNGSSGTFSMPNDMSWTETIENKAFEKKYAIERPKEMSDKEYQVYLTKLRAQEKDLRVEDGWDKSAIKEYFKAANHQTRNLTAAEAMKKVVELYGQTRLVGSELYTNMYKACSYSDQGKIDMVLKQLGAVIDKNGMLQLTGSHKFDKYMAPHDEFLAIWAKTVQGAYKGRDLTDDRVHQLRMYIDRNNINYVRETFGKGVSDEVALKRYSEAKHPLGFGGKLTKEPARLHNKLPKTSNYDEFIAGKENKKRVVNNEFHSEFIIDPDGNFVSQWNVLIERPDGTIESDPDQYNYTDEFRKQVLNGESFNYAKNKGNSHKELDSNPPGNYDHSVREKAKKGWRSPNEREFNYSKDKKSMDSYSE